MKTVYYVVITYYCPRSFSGSSFNCQSRRNVTEYGYFLFENDACDFLHSCVDGLSLLGFNVTNFYVEARCIDVESDLYDMFQIF